MEEGYTTPKRNLNWRNIGILVCIFLLIVVIFYMLMPGNLMVALLGAMTVVGFLACCCYIEAERRGALYSIP